MVKSLVYGYRNLETGEMNIGSKTAKGEDRSTYITSLKDSRFWEARALGKMIPSLLFEGDEATAKAVEHFALGYGIKVAPEKMYLKQNNATGKNEALLTPEIMRVVVDYINSGGNGISIPNSSFENDKILECISRNLKNSVYEIHQLYIDEVLNYERNQVREKQYDEEEVREIHKRMEENPEEALKVFGPIVISVRKNGSRIVIDGNTRLQAASRTRGWKKVPVVFINENEFGQTEKQIKHNWTIFGLFANKDKFEVKKPNTKGDIKRNINNFLFEEKYNLLDLTQRDNVVKIIKDNFEKVCSTKDQCVTIIKSIIKDLELEQAELQYQNNLITYNQEDKTTYEVNKYNLKGIATICVPINQAINGEAIGYIKNRMYNARNKKGAIIFYYPSKLHIVKEAQEGWIANLQKIIDFHEEDIIIDVLPPFFTS